MAKRNVVDFRIINLSEEKFQELKEAGQIDPNALYTTPDTTKERLDALEGRADNIETTKQDKLTAGAGITISDNTISATGIEIQVDSELSETSINPVQNKAVAIKTASLETTKQDIATAVNYDNITNCITEIPQDIKLELGGTKQLYAWTTENNTLYTDTTQAGATRIRVYNANGQDVTPASGRIYISSDGTYIWCDVGTISKHYRDTSKDKTIDYNNSVILKAGSKVYVPNGVGVFDVRNITTDQTYTPTSDGQYLLLVGQDTSIWGCIPSSATSGTTPPAGTGTFYNTETNSIDWYNGGTYNERHYSFPFALITVSNGAISSIDQVFNGFGYIGGTIFALPGIKGLMPYGLNQDGTLLNSSRTTSSVSTYTITWALDSDIVLDNSNVISGLYTGIKYNPKINRNESTVGQQNVIVIGKLQTDSTGMVTLFETKTAFHAVDYSDTEYIAHQAMPSDRYVDLTLPNNNGSITSPADGYFYLAKDSTATGQRVKLHNYTNTICVVSWSSGTQNLEVCLPVSKGDVVKTIYSADGKTNAFRFIYANGAK